MAKKPINIRNVEEIIFEKFKDLATQQKKTTAELFESFVNNQNTDQTEILNTQINKLNDEIIGFNNENLAFRNENNDLSVKLLELETANTILSNHVKAFENIKTQSDEKIKELETEKENNVFDKDMLLEFDGIDNYVLKMICKQETDKHNKNITPAILLKTMFLNYVIKGELYFFNTPGTWKLDSIANKFKNGELK